MNELFHTEDCGHSLICRCCRGTVCEAHLTRADRTKKQRDLWAVEYRRGRTSLPFGHAEQCLRKYINYFVEWSNRLATQMWDYFQERRETFMGGARLGNRNTSGPLTERAEVHRRPERASYDCTVVYQIIDEALYCHVGFVHHGQSYVIPTLHARIDNRLYIHGAAASRMLCVLEGRSPVCVTLTLLDGLVLARSAFHHSMNYRSAMIFGRALEVTDHVEKMRSLKAIVEHIIAGRWKDVRPPNEKELKATKVLRISIDEASAKIRRGPPMDDEQDYELSCWAGEIPLKLTSDSLRPDPHLRPDVRTPTYAQQYCRPNRRDLKHS